MDPVPGVLLAKEQRGNTEREAHGYHLQKPTLGYWYVFGGKLGLQMGTWYLSERG